MPYDNTQRQALNEAKANIARALTEAGVPSLFCDPIETLRARARRVFGPQLQGEATVEYFNRVAGMHPKSRATKTGILVPARVDEPLRARAWRPQQHPRAAEIDAQPRQISMGGIGNTGGLGGREARD